MNVSMVPLTIFPFYCCLSQCRLDVPQIVSLIRRGLNVVSPHPHDCYVCSTADSAAAIDVGGLVANDCYVVSPHHHDFCPSIDYANEIVADLGHVIYLQSSTIVLVTVCGHVTIVFAVNVLWTIVGHDDAAVNGIVFVRATICDDDPLNGNDDANEYVIYRRKNHVYRRHHHDLENVAETNDVYH